MMAEPVLLFPPPEPEPDTENEPYFARIECRRCYGKGIKNTDPHEAKRYAAAESDRHKRVTTELVLGVLIQMENEKQETCEACAGHGHVLLVHQGYICQRRGRETLWPEPCDDATNSGCCMPLWTVEQELHESRFAALSAVKV